MKKISIVLLALLLVGGMAFADITLTGSADLSFGYDLDTNDVGLTNNPYTADTAFSFTLDSASASAEGDAEVYAVIEMSGSIDVNIDGVDADEDGATANDGLEAGNEISASVSIDTAKIVGPEWELSILGMSDGLSYAVSFQDADGDDEMDDEVAGSFGDGGGATLTYGDYTVGADFYNTYNNDNTYTTAYAVYGATSMDLADGVSVGFGAGVADNGWAVSAKACYEADGLTAKAAADVKDDGTFAYDVSFSAETAVSDADLTVNAYYGTDLAVQGIVAYAPATVTVTGSTLTTAWDLAAEVALAVNDQIALTVDGGFNKAKAWNGGAEVIYTADDFTATVGGGYTSADVLDLKAIIENSTLISGATVSLGYEGTNILAADTNPDKDKGAVTAKISIAL